MIKNLTATLRPKDPDEIVGQEHLMGDGKILSSIIKSGEIRNMIFYGPPGVGKTTAAKIIAGNTNLPLVELNGSVHAKADIDKAVKDNPDGLILYIDEIHLFNKRVQQSLLSVIEDGTVTLIGATTENPHFALFKGIVSRCTILEFKPISPETIVSALEKAVAKLNIPNFTVEPAVYRFIAQRTDGDLRQALNMLELLINTQETNKKSSLTEKDIEELYNVSMLNFDSDGDSHYNILSAFHKSVRGSDPDAALIYLAIMLKGGDLQSITRRLLAIASEDIGMANPQAVIFVTSCVQSALQLGLPEAKLPIGLATVYLATSPKSNSAYMALNKAIDTVETKNPGEIPPSLQDAHYKGASSMGRGIGYKYAHDYPNHWVEQEFMPSGYKNIKLYEPAINANENGIRKYWETVKTNKKGSVK